MFANYKEGCLSRKRNGFSGFEDEVRYLYERIRCFGLSNDLEISWDARDKEIKTMQDITFLDMQEFYKDLFYPISTPRQPRWYDGISNIFNSVVEGFSRLCGCGEV